MSGPPLGLALYRAATAALEPVVPALLRFRAARGKEDPARLGERLGRASVPRPPGQLAWLHGASVGETLSLLPLVEALRTARPSLSLLVTSGTVASAELMARRLPPGVIHQFAPVDVPAVARRFLDHWRPDLAVFVESELWPNLMLGARRRGAALALLSARLSAASVSGWTRAPGAARTLLSAFSLVMAQDGPAATRLSRLGARDDGRLNLKLAGGPLPADEAALARVRAAAAAHPILLAASTHPGEEEIVLDAVAGLAGRPGRLLLVLVPRHPVRGEAVAALAAGRGFSVSRDGAGQAFDGKASVHVADTLGDLGLWLRVARAVLVGGSLVPGPGGHTPLEPARLGTPMISGPHVENWSEVYGRLAGGFIPVEDADDLAAAFASILDGSAVARAMTEQAEAVANQGEDILKTAVAKLLALVP
ncbi:MAG TPA: glycosyltransferase N-terminal domain-containing protein [Caulobacteraceae bacterium]|nr:glycosyltransferase N-terminal domain-containing protein [Caulobacteraceae bacterium]